MMNVLRYLPGITSSALLVFGAVQPAHAHLSVSPATAEPNTAAVLAFRVPDGCEGSPTVSIEISIPVAVEIVKPQPKSGWKIEFTRERAAKPIVSEGAVLQERVARIRWTGGRLADEEFEQFLIIIKVPEQAGKLVFPVVQRCEKGEAHWKPAVTVRPAL